MKKQLLLMGMGLLGTLSLHAQADPWVGQEPQAGSFYLYNVETGLWLQDNNKHPHVWDGDSRTEEWWTTKANGGTRGWEFELILPEGGDGSIFQINPHFGRNHSINGDGGFYMDTDQAVTLWNFEATGEEEGTYYIFTDAGATLALDANGDINSTGENQMWKLVTKAERLAELAKATVDEPQDATWLIDNPDLAENTEYNGTSWKIQNSNNGGANGFGGAGYTGCNSVYEAWQRETFSMYQDVTLPNGKYLMTVSGFYRDGSEKNLAALYEAGDEQIRASYYAGGTKKPFMSIMAGGSTEYNDRSYAIQISDKYIPGNLTGGNAMERASQCIYEGGYVNSPIEATVTGGTLRIGVEKSERVDDDWLIFDKFTLTYYGDNVDISDYVNALQAAIDEAERTDVDMTDAVKEQLDAAIAEGNELIGGTDTDAMTEATATLTTLTDLAKAMATNTDLLRRTEALTAGAADADLQAADAAAKEALANATTTDEVNNALNTLRTARKVAARETMDDVFAGNAPAAGNDYYIYNVGRKQFLVGGGSWGAHAFLGFPGVEITLEADGDGYRLNTHLNNGEENGVQKEYLNYGGYMDTPGDTWSLVDAGNGTYNIMRTNQDTDDETGETSAYMLGFRPGTVGNVDTDMTGGDDPNNQWKLITKADRDALLEEASAENPVDCSYLIGSPNFSQRTDISAWSFNETSIYGRGDDLPDFACEAWNKTNATLSQVMTDLLPGYYVLSCQGYYRDGTREAHAEKVANGEEVAQNAVFWANSADDVYLMPVHQYADMAPDYGWTSSVGNFPDHPTQAVEFFQLGYYKNVTIVEVGDDGALEFGIDKFSGEEEDWFVVDNFRLVYTGADEPVTGISGIKEVAPAKTGKIYNLQGVQVKDATQRGIYIRDGKKFIVK